MSNKNTIGHIEGLRGWAIGFVVLFHYFKAVPNGYFGVDVFLAISGYFLLRAFATEAYDFRFSTFCCKKVARLYAPALVVLGLLLMVVAAVLPSSYLLHTAQESLAAVAGVSNVWFDWTAQDYFADTSLSSPLLHTWYFALMVQCYLIFGGMLAVCRRASRRVKVALLCCMTACSFPVGHQFLFSWAVPGYEPSSVYYLTSGRLWIFALAGLLHFIPVRRESLAGNVLFGVSCAVLICLSLCPFALDGALCDVPVVLSTLVLLVVVPARSIAWLLDNTLSRWLGKISYSLYLVHWPIFVLWGNFLPSLSLWFAVGVSVAAAWALYHAVEKRKIAVRWVWIGIVCTACCSLAVIRTDGMKQYLHREVNQIQALLYPNARPMTSPQQPLVSDLPAFCPEPHPAASAVGLWDQGKAAPLLYDIGLAKCPASFILMGDSHAESLFPGLDVLARRRGWRGAYLHTYVVPFENYGWDKMPFQLWTRQKADMLEQWLSAHKEVKTVLLAQFWKTRMLREQKDWSGRVVTPQDVHAEMAEKLRGFLLRLRRAGKEVVVFTDIPATKGGDIVLHIQKRLIFGMPLCRAYLSCSESEYQRANGTINEMLCRLEAEGLCRVLHPEHELLQGGEMQVYTGNYRMWYRDGNHLSFPGSVRVVEHLESELEQLLSPTVESK